MSKLNGIKSAAKRVLESILNFTVGDSLQHICAEHQAAQGYAAELQTESDAILAARLAHIENSKQALLIRTNDVIARHHDSLVILNELATNHKNEIAAAKAVLKALNAKGGV